MRSIKLIIAAGASEDIAVVGDYVRIQVAGTGVSVRIKSGDDGAVDATIEQGDALNLKPFSRLTVSHTSAAQQTITLLIGNGSSADSAKVGGAIEVTKLPTPPAPAFAFTQTAPAVGVASGVLVAAKADRRFLMVQNLSVSQDVVLNLAGGVAVLATDVKLAPGASLLLDVATPSSAINAIASAAGAVVVVVEG